MLQNILLLIKIAYFIYFIDNVKAIGSHLCDKDQYDATYIF